MDPRARNPFQDDVYVEHPDQLPGVTRIHHDLFQRIAGEIENLVTPPDLPTPADRIGRILLVTAPRAGYGKSHLVARLDHRLSAIASTFELSLDPARPITWPAALSSLLRQLGHAPATRSGAASLLQETGRHFLARLALSDRTEEGSPDSRPASTADLRIRYAEICAPEHPSGLLAWIDEHSRRLADGAEPSLIEATGLSRNELGFWARLLIDYQHRADAALEPLRGLSSGEARERTLQLLRIHSFQRPVLLVADGLDGFFQSETAGLEIANLLTSIREAVPRGITLVCVNEDVWDSVFQDRLPSAWLDRLAGEGETLRPVSPEEAGELIESRLERTPMSRAGIEAFVGQLRDDHLWVDSETRLSPRSVLRQARDLWNERADHFLSLSSSSEADDSEPDLSELTDKPEFFESLREDGLPEGGLRAGESAARRRLESPSRPASTLPPPLPREKTGESETRTPKQGADNPFFAPPDPEASPPNPEKEDRLAGIESIIADIRGTGKTVVSESSTESPSSPPSETIEAGQLRVKPGPSSRAGSSGSPGSASSQSAPDLHAGFDPPKTPPPASRGDIEHELRETREECLASAPLTLDLERIAGLLRSLGAAHGGLSQTEERFPGSRLPCLRWVVRGHPVVIGFESPGNGYFWNHLLQQSLASDHMEKISAFSHPSESFDPSFFSGFGFSPSVIRGRIDVIEMNDRELSMLYAADRMRERYRDRPEEDTAREVISLYLDPLWRRIGRPL